VIISTKRRKNPDANMEELPPDHHCAKNWSESSKAMEPMGIVECTIEITDPRSGVK